ncbi:MAG TPA: DUF6308 family protein [Candidatus Aquicultor sp.]|jgi:hypothetical protein
MERISGELILRSNKENQVSIPAKEFADKVVGLQFLHFYDAADVKQDNEISPQDWTVSILLNGVPNWKNVRDALWDEGTKSKWHEVNAKLEQVDAGWHLTDEAASEYEVRFKALLTEMLTVNGIGSPIAIKILHKKRPNLIPVVERIVAQFYLGWSLTSQDNVQQVESASSIIFNHFRNDLVLDSNQAAIAKIQNRISSGDNGFSLTDVRILELAIWLLSDTAGPGKINAL